MRSHAARPAETALAQSLPQQHKVPPDPLDPVSKKHAALAASRVAAAVTVERATAPSLAVAAAAEQPPGPTRSVAPLLQQRWPPSIAASSPLPGKRMPQLLTVQCLPLQQELLCLPSPPQQLCAVPRMRAEPLAPYCHPCLLPLPSLLLPQPSSLPSWNLSLRQTLRLRRPGPCPLCQTLCSY